MITQIAQQKATAYLSIFAILCNKALNLKKENVQKTKQQK